MQTAIGQRLTSSPARLATACALAALVLAADLALVCRDPFSQIVDGRSVLALVALAAYLLIVQGDRTSLGFRLTPRQGWRHWARVSALLGLAVAACFVVGMGLWVLTGHEMPVYTTAPGHIGTTFVEMCVYYPLLEETIYRLVLCVPLAVLLGPWWAIAVSGLVFGGLHVVYGNPSPENLVGGFFLAWAYLRSESFAVPVLLHSLGNLGCLASQVGAWYWLGGAS